MHRFPCVVGMLLALAVLTTGCKKKLKITKLCVQTHHHVLGLIKKEHAALPSGEKANAAQKKEKARLGKLLQKLTSKRGKERSLIVCTKMSKKKVLQVRHLCALEAKTTLAVQHCYKPPKKKKGKGDNKAKAKQPQPHPRADVRKAAQPEKRNEAPATTRR